MTQDRSIETQRIDGKAAAEHLRTEIAAAVERLKSSHGLVPGLAVVLVGNDPASEIYVRNKGKQTRAAGMHSLEHRLPGDVSQDELLTLVRTLNDDPAIHGILVQMPLPDHIDTNTVIDTIDPAKDVDGLGPVSTGLLALGRPGFIPCTPLGCRMLLHAQLGPDLSGYKAVVVGRSILVGKPMAQLLLADNCTVTLAHSRTRDLAAECRAADILVAAAGKPRLVAADWIKPGATVIDVGINRLPAPDLGEGKSRIVGDVDFEGAQGRAGAITPVPGGVGPMTIACLLRNTVFAACRLAKVETPDLGIAA